MNVPIEMDEGQAGLLRKRLATEAHDMPSSASECLDRLKVRIDRERVLELLEILPTWDIDGAKRTCVVVGLLHVK